LLGLLFLALEIGDDLARGIGVDRANGNGLGTGGGLAALGIDLGLARSPEVEHHADDAADFGVDKQG
jgi:hypothetical protein